MRRLRHLLAATAVTAALVVVPFAGSAFADPLPPGAYDVPLSDGTVTITVSDEGVAVDAPDGVEVGLTFDDDGAVQDVFYVRTDAGVVRVELEVDDERYDAEVSTADDDDFPAEDGSALAVTDGDTEDADETHGDLVSTVAECAPSGREAREVGLPNHGTIVSAAARGDLLTLELPVVPSTDGDAGDGGTTAGDEQGTTADGEDAAGEATATAPVAFDLATVEGVNALCEALEALTTTSDDGAAADDDEADEDEADADDADEDEADEGRGEVTSTAATCLPSGREARDAGLPNHGRLVSQVARGEVVTVDGIDGEFDTSTVEGVEALCTALEDAITVAQAEAEAAELEDDGEADERPGNGNGRGQGPDRDGDRGNGNGNGRGKGDDRDA